MADSATRSRGAPRSLSRDDVLRLAHLARLELSEDETERFVDQLSAILTYIDQLEAVPLTPPTEAPPTEAPLDGRYSSGAPSTGKPSSPQAPQLALSVEAMLANAPQTVQDLIAVPPVIGGGAADSEAASPLASNPNRDPATP